MVGARDCSAGLVLDQGLLRRVEAGEDVVIRRGREPVAMLVRVSPRTGKRQIWADLEGSMSPEFDELPSDFDGYT